MPANKNENKPFTYGIWSDLIRVSKHFLELKMKSNEQLDLIQSPPMIVLLSKPRRIVFIYTIKDKIVQSTLWLYDSLTEETFQFQVFLVHPGGLVTKCAA